MSSADDSDLGTLALLFLRLGFTAFGGPAAHIALMQDEVVRRRHWMSNEEFLDLLGATNLIPGPNSTEMAIHVGYKRAGWPGLLVAGACFIGPAMLTTGVLAWAYVRFGHTPEVGWLLYGVKPVVLAIVAQAIVGLAPRAAPSSRLRMLGVAVGVLALLGVDEIALLIGAGLASVALRSWRGAGMRSWALALGVLGAPTTTTAGAAAATQVGLLPLFWVFAKIGSVLFGSGYVLLAFLQADLVDRLGWLSSGQLVDAVAVGQLTPGPVFSTATFVGYLLAGTPGALVATVGIFLPAFVFVAASAPFLPWLRASTTAAAFLDGVNVAALALMAVVTVALARAALVDVPAVLIGGATAALLLWREVNTTWLILLGALLGLMLRALALA
jgi:chromate transporter